ncbi:MAG: transposase, partial [Armatimonadota bacterium]
EANADIEVEQVIGDTAYGSMKVRKELGDREVIAPTVKGGRGTAIPKDEFEIDFDNDRVTCPEGHTTDQYTWVTYRTSKNAPAVKVKRFVFDTDLCRACPRYDECVKSKRRYGRTITLHPDEKLLREARALEKTEYFRDTYRERVVVEHRIGRLVSLGIRQSRFFGRKKTEFQALMAAAVANFTLVANWLTSEDGPGSFHEHQYTQPLPSQKTKFNAYSDRLPVLPDALSLRQGYSIDSMADRRECLS